MSTPQPRHRVTRILLERLVEGILSVAEPAQLDEGDAPLFENSRIWERVRRDRMQLFQRPLRISRFLSKPRAERYPGIQTRYPDGLLAYHRQGIQTSGYPGPGIQTVYKRQPQSASPTSPRRSTGSRVIRQHRGAAGVTGRDEGTKVDRLSLASA